jgi:ABC-2 type transport system ATP-binding protein
VAVISKGEIVAEGPPGTLAGRGTAATTIRFRPPDGVGDLPEWGQTAASDGVLEIQTGDPTRMLHEMTGWAVDRNARFELLEAHRPSLEDVYLELTKAGESRGEATDRAEEALA